METEPRICALCGRDLGRKALRHFAEVEGGLAHYQCVNRAKRATRQPECESEAAARIQQRAYQREAEKSAALRGDRL